jgi:hypothetical protein
MQTPCCTRRLHLSSCFKKFRHSTLISCFRCSMVTFAFASQTRVLYRTITLMKCAVVCARFRSGLFCAIHQQFLLIKLSAFFGTCGVDCNTTFGLHSESLCTVDLYTCTLQSCLFHLSKTTRIPIFVFPNTFHDHLPQVGILQSAAVRPAALARERWRRLPLALIPLVVCQVSAINRSGYVS